ncbi:MAG: hypothetical protein AAFV53_19255 [Myxococcota bacterium]
MSRFFIIASLLLFQLTGCGSPKGTEPPPDGWANNAPTVVTQVVQRDDTQLLRVRQGQLAVWVAVPNVGAAVGDYVLLGRGTARRDVDIPELKLRAPEIVDIAHVQVVDEQTAQRAVVSQAPRDAVAVGTIYAELDQRADTEIVVYGTAVKVSSAVGSVWVHVQDGTGDANAGTHDIMVQTDQAVARGQRVAFRGVLRKDADLGFGYQYDAMLEEASFIQSK